MGYQLIHTNIDVSADIELDLNVRINPLRYLHITETRTSNAETHTVAIQSAENYNLEESRPQETNLSQKRLPSKITEITGTYLDHPKISISGNSDFNNTASSEGWNGTGTAGDPYIIEDYNITGTGTEYLIDIRNTDVYFRINHSLLHGGDYGLIFTNVTNGKVSFVDAYNNNFDGFYLSLSSNNTLTNNTAYNNSKNGFYLRPSSSNNTLSSNTAYNNSKNGFYLYSSSNNTLTKNTAYNNIDHGVHLYSSSNNNILASNTAYNNSYGFYLWPSSSNNTLSNNTAYNNSYGFYLKESYNNTLYNNTAYDNIQNGFLLSSSSNNNTLNDNTAYNNKNGFILSSSSNNNTLSNNTAYNHTQEGFALYTSYFNTLSNNTAYNNSNGYYLLVTSNNTLSSNTAYNHTNHGFYFESFSNNTLTNNRAYSNTQDGFHLYYSSNNTLTNNRAYSNSDHGFGLTFSSSYNMLTWNTVSNNSDHGFYLYYSINNTLVSNIVYNNSDYGIYLGSHSYNNTITKNKLVDNNSGSTQGFDDGANNIFQFNYWSDLTSPDINQDFIVDQPYDIVGSAENQDTSPLVIYVISHSPISINGNSDFQNTASSEGWSGTGTVGAPYIIEDYNITGTGYLIDIQNTNVYFRISRLLLHGGSCGLYFQNVTNGKVSDVYAYNNSLNGFRLSSSYNNTLTSNTAYNNSGTGFGLTSSSNNNLSRNTAYNNSGNGFGLTSSSNNNLSRNTAYNNSLNGFFLSSSTNYNSLSRNTAVNNTWDGFALWTSSSNNILIRNTAYTNEDGFCLHSSSNDNILINNTAYNNSGTGFVISLSSNNTGSSNTAYNNYDGFSLSSSYNNTLTSNTAYNNSDSGFYFWSSSNNNSLTNNTAYNNRYYGFVLISSNNNTLTRNTAYNNSDSGFLFSSSNNNTLTRNAAYNNSDSGFLFSSSYNNTLTRNTAYNNSDSGFFLISSSNNTLSGNTVYNNTFHGFYLYSSSNNNMLISNTICSNRFHGFYFLSDSNNNTVTRNELINNNGGSAQAYDDGSNNIFQFNYWSDLTSPDINQDFIVDQSYAIPGAGLNQDTSPLVIYVISHSPISINGNTDFHNTASFEGWSGTGTVGAPYIIEDYNITGTGYLIDIRNTDVYFRISHSLLHGGERGLYFQNVTNGKVSDVYAFNNTHGFRFWFSCKNITLINNTAFNNTNMGFDLSSSNSALTNNTAYNNGYEGFQLSSSTNNTLTRNTAYNNGYEGFQLSGSSNNTLTRNTAYNNYRGFHIFSSDDNTLSRNTAYNNTEHGFSLSGSSNNILTRNTAYNNTNYGFQLSSSTNNTLNNNTAYHNTNYGFQLSSSTNNTLNNNTAYNHKFSGFYLGSNSNNNTLTRNTAYDNSNYGFQLSLSTNNTLSNNTAYNHVNCGFWFDWSHNNTLSNNTAYNNRYSFWISSSSNNTLSNNTAYNNSDYGFYLMNDCNENTLSRNTAYNNTQDGFYLLSSSNNALSRNTAYNNSNYGFHFELSSNNNTLTSNTAYNNNYDGFYLKSSSNNTLISNAAYNNSNYGFYLNYYSSNNTLTSNTANNNSDYGFQLSLSSNNTLTSNTAYNNYRGFYLISSSNNSLTSNTAYNNGYYGFYLDSSSNNNTLSNNTANNNGYYGFYLSSSSNNTLSNNTAYDSVSGFQLSGSSNNPLTSNTAYNNRDYGFYLSSSSNNPLITNTAYNNNGYGFFLSSSSNNNTLTSNTAYNNSRGFYLSSSSNNTLSSNTAHNNIYDGFVLYSSSDNTLTSNTAYNNNDYGFQLSQSSSNTLTNNTAYNNSNGLYLQSSSNNTLTNNTAYNNNYNGFWLQSSSDNTLSSNTAYDNNDYGFYLFSSHNNTLTTNTADNNSSTGFGLESSSNNTLTSNTAYNNSVLGFYLTSSSITNTLISNTADNNGIYGFVLISSSNNNTLTNNTAYNNSEYGIYVTSSYNNVIQRNKFMNNKGGSTQAYDDSNNIFQFNHWSDWTNPDIDGNLVVDLPYAIDGSAINQDDYPLVIFFIAPIITLINPINNTDQQSGTIISVNVIDPTALDQVKYNWDGSGNMTVPLANSSYVFNSILPISEVQHILFVYGQDHLGNWHSRQFNFITDDTPPEILLNSPLNGSIHLSGTSIDLTLVGSNGSLIYHWNSDGNITVTDTTDPVLPVGDGVHNLYLYARDEAGNWNFTYLEFTTDDPLAILLNNPVNGTVLQSGSIINITITGSNGSLIYNWDGNTNASESDSFDPVLPIGDGLHHLYLYAKDDLGNWHSKYLEYTTDDTAPLITLNNPINGTINCSGTVIDLTITGSNGSLIYHWDNNDNQTVVDTDEPVLPIGDGLHHLYLYAKDNVGNWNFTYLEFTTDDPLLILLNYPVNGTVLQSGSIIDITITGSNGSLIYNWDGNSNASESDSFDPVLPVGDGLHHLYLYAKDNLGNWKIMCLEFTTDDPLLILLNNPVNGTVLQSGSIINITITGSNGSLIHSWDGNSNVSESDLFDPILPIGDGLHHLYLYARDNLGNWNFTYLEYITDDTAPLITLTNPINGTINRSGTVIDLTITGSNGSLIYHWDNNDNQTVVDTDDPVLPVGDGIHQLFLYAEDYVDNWIFVYFEFITDDTPPQITFLSNIDLNETAILPAAQIQFNITDISQVQVYITWDDDLTQPNLNASLTVTSPSSGGWHELVVDANDSVGLLTRSYYIFYVDTLAPVISLQDIFNGSQVSLGTTIYLNISDQEYNRFLDNVTYYWDSGTSVTVSVLSEISPPQSAGWHNLHIFAIDTVGNANIVVFRFLVTISVTYDPEEWVIPSTVFEGDQFTLEFTFTNNEDVTLDFGAFLLGEDHWLQDNQNH
jgi:parallel beta-helix repeat protein